MTRDEIVYELAERGHDALLDMWARATPTGRLIDMTREQLVELIISEIGFLQGLIDFEGVPD